MKHGFTNYVEQQRLDEEHIATAIEIAESGKMRGEIPTGACLVMPRYKISEHNTVWSEGDALNHAEINVLKKARELGFRNLKNSIMYSTVEPSILCAMAALEYGIHEFVFGAYDTKNGFVSSGKLKLDELNLAYRGGVLAQECRTILPTRLQEHTKETNESV